MRLESLPGLLALQSPTHLRSRTRSGYFLPLRKVCADEAVPLDSWSLNARKSRHGIYSLNAQLPNSHLYVSHVDVLATHIDHVSDVAITCAAGPDISLGKRWIEKE